MKKLLLLFLNILLFLNCTPQIVVYKSDKGFYQQAMSAYYSGRYAEAEISFNEIEDNFSNSGYQNFVYLGLADVNLRNRTKSALLKSATFYQIYLEQEISENYTPYVLENLMILSLKNNASQVFFPKLKSDRADSYFRDIVDNYYRFAIFYPESIYFQSAKNYYLLANNYLANHEFEVANWYFRKKLYYPAILRYNFLLKNYPNFSKNRQAFQRLIFAYKKVDLLEKAKELEQL